MGLERIRIIRKKISKFKEVKLHVIGKYIYRPERSKFDIIGKNKPLYESDLNFLPVLPKSSHTAIDGPLSSFIASI